MYRRTTTLTVLRVVEEFHDDETPTLPGMRVYDTTGEEVTNMRPLAKCGPLATAGADRRRKAAK